MSDKQESEGVEKYEMKYNCTNCGYKGIKAINCGNVAPKESVCPRCGTHNYNVSLSNFTTDRRGDHD